MDMIPDELLKPWNTLELEEKQFIIRAGFEVYSYTKKVGMDRQ